MSNVQRLPSRSYLEKYLRYDPETGKLFWRKRKPEDYDSLRNGDAESCFGWNACFAGKEAFIAVSHGYLAGTLRRRIYLAHRVIWKMVYGTDPNVIDHIDGNKMNNRVSNLRSVTARVNAMNRRRNKNNSTGVTGVSFERGKFRAKISVESGQKHIGYFDTLSEAKSARLIAQNKYGYSKRHGCVE